ncbi:MAG TPA: SDR family oxidoreductase [candidate division Zixibacteria bacterium]|nr:SDR family oxidoreductase [candidate division Zixibacteria bacterium]
MRDEVVVITGASAGVGRATARLFGQNGARVALIARGKDGLQAAAREIQQSGGKALVLPLDVADPGAMEQASKFILRRWGQIDIWVNNAMASVFSPVKEMRAEEYRRVTEVTYLGFVYGTLAALHHMLPRNGGTIVQVGSALAYRSIPLQSAYCAAKHAIVGFTDSLRCELLHDGSNVQITIVHMPALNTTQFGWVKSRLKRKAQPVPPIFQPEVAARAIYHAAHHPRREYWVGFSTAAAILGQRVAPALLDRYLGRTGYDSQQYDGAENPNRADNLWRPVPGDHGAHGAFDKRAHDEAGMQVSESAVNYALGAAGAAIFSALSYLIVQRKNHADRSGTRETGYRSFAQHPSRERAM